MSNSTCYGGAGSFLLAETYDEITTEGGFSLELEHADAYKPNLEIVNCALVWLGECPADTLEGASRKTVQVLVSKYEHVRRMLLREYQWMFAQARRVLPALDFKPDFGWGYAHECPSDFVRIIQPSDRSTRVKQEGRFIFSDEPTLNLVYIRDEWCVDMMDDLFKESFALRLALEVVQLVNRTQDTRISLRQSYEDTIAKARFSDSIQQSNEAFQTSSWLTARDTGVNYPTSHQGEAPSH